VIVALSQELLAEAFALDEQDRLALSWQLLDSVHPRPVGEHNSWTDEIRARLAKIEADEADLIDADQVLERYRAQRAK